MKGKSQIAFTRPSTSKSVSTFDSIRGRNDDKNKKPSGKSLGFFFIAKVSTFWC
jgi:hypothetical protein